MRPLLVSAALAACAAAPRAGGPFTAAGGCAAPEDHASRPAGAQALLLIEYRRSGAARN